MCSKCDFLGPAISASLAKFSRMHKMTRQRGSTAISVHVFSSMMRCVWFFGSVFGSFYDIMTNWIHEMQSEQQGEFSCYRRDMLMHAQRSLDRWIEIGDDVCIVGADIAEDLYMAVHVVRSNGGTLWNGHRFDCTDSLFSFRS